ncbi:MAG: hypothetical protein KIT84_37460 [Labilithrix sp.]|nr:hypothetical protein [Labilithrix sp.]MCW5816748.1 hypothetical protein [Labilithrix sp.]
MLLLGVFATGCDSEDPEPEAPPAQPAQVNEQIAASMAQSTIGALSASAGAGGSSAASLAAVAQSSQGLLQSSSPGAPGTRSVASALDVAGGAVGLRDLDGPGCTCTATECNFVRCSPLSASTSSGGYEFTIDGYYSWADGHVVCRDLKYTFSASGASTGGLSASNVDVTLSCDLTVTSSSIDGFIRSAGATSTSIAGQSTQFAYSSSWDVTTTFDDVTFGASRAPTGGSMHVEGTTSVTYGDQTTRSAGKADVTFPIR